MTTQPNTPTREELLRLCTEAFELEQDGLLDDIQDERLKQIAFRLARFTHDRLTNPLNVPPGYEVTPQMAFAGAEALREWWNSGLGYQSIANHVFDAMLLASPKVEQGAFDIGEPPDCGDNSCMFAKNKGGMRTNGGCRCLKDVSWKTRVYFERLHRALATPSPNPSHKGTGEK